MTARLGAPDGTIQTFVDVSLTVAGTTTVRDGVIRVADGEREWTALVGVKTGSESLDAAQLADDLRLADELDFDAVLTISNEIPAISGQHPLAVDEDDLGGIALHHYSWSELLAQAVSCWRQLEVADPDRAWVLGELISYLEHPQSGTLQFDDVGSSWVAVRDALAAGTLRANDPGLPDVTARFDALIRFASLRLGRRLATGVVPLLSARESADPAFRSRTLQEGLIADGTLTGAIRIPGVAGPLVVRLDLRADTVTCHFKVDAPREGRAVARVSWLVRQLPNASPRTRIEAFGADARVVGRSASLRAIREDPSALVDPRQELRGFRIALEQPMGVKRGLGRGTVIDSVLAAIDAFQSEVVAGFPVPTPAPDPQQGQQPRPPSRRELRHLRAVRPQSPQSGETGWYLDVEDPGQLRWWDGADWSEQVYPDQHATQ